MIRLDRIGQNLGASSRAPCARNHVERVGSILVLEAPRATKHQSPRAHAVTHGDDGPLHGATHRSQAAHISELVDGAQRGHTGRCLGYARPKQGERDSRRC